MKQESSLVRILGSNNCYNCNPLSQIYDGEAAFVLKNIEKMELQESTSINEARTKNLTQSNGKQQDSNDV